MHRFTRPRLAVAAGVAVVALAGTGVAVANAATPSATPTTTGTTATAHRTHKARPSLHSISARKGRKGTFVTVGTQRGTITAVSPTSLTASSIDGFVQTYVIGPDTKVRLDKQTAAVSALKVGDKVGIAAVESGTTWTAKRAIAHS